MGTIGPRLRAAREARNLSVEQAAEDTRISLRFLEALEREEFEALPAPVYVRGFLRSYANYLGLEPQSLLDELTGEQAAEATPGPYLRGPDRRDRRSAPAASPAAVETAMAVEPRANSEWDPDPGAQDDVYAYEDDSDYHPEPVAGVLVERGYTAGSGGTARTVMVAGIALIFVLAVIGVAFAMQGGGDGDPPLGVGGDGDPTATLSGGVEGRTVIPVGNETPEGTPGTPGTAGTPGTDGTAAAGETAEPGTTTEATPTETSDETPTPEATATVATSPTPVPTTAPTLTSTPVPPTATPEPTATPVIVHPLQTAECPRTGAGEVQCGEGELLVICGPNGWFVDYDRDYPNTQGWSTFGYTGFVTQLSGYAATACVS